MTRDKTLTKHEKHAKLVKDILTTCGALECCRIWKNDTGMAMSLDGARHLRYGLKGSADIIGIGQGGIFIAIECKTGSAVQNKRQIAFQEMIEKFGGIYLLAHEDDACIVKDMLTYLCGRKK